MVRGRNIDPPLEERVSGRYKVISEYESIIHVPIQIHYIVYESGTVLKKYKARCNETEVRLRK